MKNIYNTVRSKCFRAGSTTAFMFSFLCFLCTFSIVNAQETTKSNDQSRTVTVTGIVRDAHTKNPIAAAQIQALNNLSSATTDEKGRFSIKLSRLDEVLSVKAYDYSVREFPLRGSMSLEIDLYPETFSNYYSDQDILTGSVRNSIVLPSAKTFKDFKLSQAISADEFVQSELGGNVRSVSRSGMAGMGSSMFIRGLNSLNANAQPLYVVDGAIFNNNYDVESIFEGHFSNPLLNIDINDIESITVLKDGTSVYGSKGSNGVILIKTSRSKDQVTKINVNLTTGMISTPNQIPVMNADQYRIYASDMIGTAGYTNKEISELGFIQTDPSLSTYNVYHNNTNWADESLRKGSTQSYSINVQGGDDKALYYFSLGYTGNNSIVKESDMTRINTRFNADINLAKNVSLALNVSYTNHENHIFDDGVNFYTSPTYLSLIKSPFLSPNTFTYYGSKTLDLADEDELGIGNPTALINNSLNYTRQHFFDFGLTPVWKINKNLTLSSQIDYNLNKYEENYYRPMLGCADQYLEGYGYSYNMIKHQLIRNISIFNDTRLSFKKKFNGVHNIDAMLGWRYSNNYYEMDYIEGHNTGSDNNTILKNSYDYLKDFGANNLTKSVSTYANIDYNFANRYFLSAAVSMDGSSRFGKTVEKPYQFFGYYFADEHIRSDPYSSHNALNLFGQSWAIFPSLGAGWLVSSEKFMENVAFVNLLKLRAGYGMTGNDGIKDYASRAYFETVRYLGKANGIVISNISNDKLQWETTGRANAGLDLGLFNERLNLTMDVFSSRTNNLLIWRSLGDLAGLDAYQTNAGELSNKGFEFSANLKLLNLKKFQWEIGITTGHYKNRIESLPEGDIITNVYGGTVLTTVGQPVGVFYGFKTDGVYANQTEADAANLSVLNINGTYTKFAAGDVRFIDNKADNILNDEDKQIIGDPNPDFYGSFTSKISYGKLTLSALFNYSYGNDVYNYLRSQLESGSTMSNQTSAMLSRWTTEDQKTNMPKAVYGDPMGNARFSDRWIEDGSYLRIKTISLSYKIPVKTSFISGVDVWVAANNLYTWTNYLGYDPEFSAKNSVLYQGVDAGLIPLTKSFFAGVKISL